MSLKFPRLAYVFYSNSTNLSYHSHVKLWTANDENIELN